MWPVPGFEDRLIYYIPRDDLIDVIRVLGGPQDRDSTLKQEEYLAEVLWSQYFGTLVEL